MFSGKFCVLTKCINPKDHKKFKFLMCYPLSEVCLRPFQTVVMKRFAKIFNGVAFFLKAVGYFRNMSYLRVLSTPLAV